MSAVTWAESPQRGTWTAGYRGAALTVTRLGLDRWQAHVRLAPGSGRNLDRRSPVVRTRLAAQAWAERTAKARQAGGAS